MKNAIILCSGGLDSVTTAYYVKKKLKYNNIVILFFNYKQKSLECERESAIRAAKKLNASFKEINLEELGKLSTSLINKSGDAKSLSLEELKDTRKEGRKWYVPFRNSVFLIYALSLAESLFVKDKIKHDLFVGFKSSVGEGYPDTSSGFLKVIKKLSKYSMGGEYNIKSPLINKEKEDIVLLGKKLGVDFKDTFSCYVGKNKHCGVCLSCRLRQESFYWANLKDPTLYSKKLKDYRGA